MALLGDAGQLLCQIGAPVIDPHQDRYFRPFGHPSLSPFRCGRDPRGDLRILHLTVSLSAVLSMTLYVDNQVHATLRQPAYTNRKSLEVNAERPVPSMKIVWPS